MVYTSRAFNLTVVPLAMNLFLTVSSFYNVNDFGTYPELCYTTMFLALAPSFATLIGFAYTHDLRPFGTLLALAAHGVLLILVFAGVYRGAGLIHSGAIERPVEVWTAIYFSIITWTTVGYGDYAPTYAIQMIAAIQAMMGYIFFGTTVGIVTAILSRESTGTVTTVETIEVIETETSDVQPL